MTLVTETDGFLWFHQGTPLLTPHEEAKELAHFYLDVLKLPVALLVDETPITKRPDGEIRRGRTPIRNLAGGWNERNLMLVDRDGRIQWLGNWDSLSWDRRLIGSWVQAR